MDTQHATERANSHDISHTQPLLAPPQPTARTDGRATNRRPDRHQGPPKPHRSQSAERPVQARNRGLTQVCKRLPTFNLPQSTEHHDDVTRACVRRNHSAFEVWCMCSRSMAASPTRRCRCRWRHPSNWGSQAQATHGGPSERSALLMDSYSTRYQHACGKCTVTVRLISWPSACIAACPQAGMRRIPGKSSSSNTVCQYSLLLLAYPPTPLSCTHVELEACHCKHVHRWCRTFLLELAQHASADPVFIRRALR